ncbi:NAD(P)/FAD-dependent oxidoreductase [Nonomuraea sp. NPDC050536]|uniref:NAD(P)/FAD-dependent oxidoreductase n=1 Tax=Nonomuraea sp. NPDC050536 TaxID=3364366 RepID=UPI0037CA9BA2
MSTTADAVVVGAGVIGASIALELSRLGLEVLVVDKAGGAGHGSTSASSAVVRFNYSTWAGVVAAWESWHCWTNWAEHVGHRDAAGTASFRRTGMVLLDAPIAPRDQTVALFEQVGVPYEEWDADTLRARVPGIDSGRYWPPKPVDDSAFLDEADGELGAVYTPDAGFVDDPQLAAHNLAAGAQRLGARFAFHSQVVAVFRQGDRVRGVRLSDGSAVLAPIVVNAAGPWSGALNRLAGAGAEFTIGVRPMRQEVHQVRMPEGFGGDAEFGPAIADMDLGVYIRPVPGAQLLIGGTEPECDPLEWVDDPDTAHQGPTVERFWTQVLRAARRLPGLTVPNIPRGVAGVYDVADDWTPIYDRTDLAGYYVAMGTSGNQFKNAPIVGRVMATLIERVEAGHDHDSDPVRHRCEHTGLEIDLSAFSRKRPVRQDAPRTVMG